MRATSSADSFEIQPNVSWAIQRTGSRAACFVG